MPCYPQISGAEPTAGPCSSPSHVFPVTPGQFLTAGAAHQHSPRRSNDGQTIMKGSPGSATTTFDQQFLVGALGFEPRTSRL
jgi:hypothetical protein